MVDQAFTGTQFRRQVFVRVALLLLMFCCVTSLATLGFMIVEDLSFFDALYMAVVTFTTVGYGDLVPLTPQGRVFAMVIIFSGLLGSGISIAILVDLIFEKAIFDMFRGRKLDKRIDQFKDHHIVCGCGVTGRFVVKALLSNGEKVVVIDWEHQDLENSQNLIVIEGDARTDDVLRRAGIARAKGLAAALQDDADNVFVVLTARSLNQNLEIVSRYKDEDTEKKLYIAGANRAISPYRMGGRSLFQALTAPLMASMVDEELLHQKPALTFSDVAIPESYRQAHAHLGQAKAWCDAAGIILVAAYDQQEHLIFNPDPQTKSTAVARLLVLGEMKKNLAFGELLG